MSLSTITAFDFIADPSFATPGLFNRIFSQLSDNIGTMNQAGVSPTILSGSTWASIGLTANSSNSDYIRMKDSSGQRSTYRIGSAAGGTADGLNIFDESGNTLIASFSKQSIRFYQNVVGPVFDTGGALTSTLNAATLGDGSQSKESRIQAAIVQASQQGLARVYLPANMYPYSASSVSFVYPVQMVREGGDQSTYDARAYGAYADFVADDTAALQAAIGSAIVTKGTVFLPHSTASYKLTAALSVNGANGLAILGDARGAILHQTTASARIFSGGGISYVDFSKLVLGGSFTIGIAMSTIDHCSIRDCSISGGTTTETSGLSHCGGILLNVATNILIDNNSLSGNGQYGLAPLVRGSDIQVGEEGNLSSNVKVTRNTCSSTSVKSNIALFDTDGFAIEDNECSGAKTLGTSGGYGIIAYASVTSGLKNGRISGNHVSLCEGTGVYVQALIDGAVSNNVIATSGTSETEGTLVVGGIGLSNCLRVTVSGGAIRNSGLNGVVVASTDTTLTGCVVTGVSIDSAGGKGIKILGTTAGVSVVGNSIRNTLSDGIGNVDNGGSTLPLDHIIVTGNSIASVGGSAIALLNATNCAVVANTVAGATQRGVVMASGTGDRNIIAANNISGTDAGAAGYDSIYCTTTNSEVRENICSGAITLSGAGTRQLNNRASNITLSGGAASQIVVDDGKNLLITNVVGTDFGRMQLGGTTSAFPALRRGTGQLDIVLADNSAYGGVNAFQYFTKNGCFVETIVNATYSASITFAAGTGNSFVVAATNGTAFTINAPTGPATGLVMDVTIKNSSGGALGVITWNAVFKMAAFTNPANGFSRTVRFRYDGTNWVERRVDADVPN